MFPAYNEEDRILPTLEEAVEYLDKHIGRNKDTRGSFSIGNRRHQRAWSLPGFDFDKAIGGYEILIVNDGSNDKTVQVALDFAHKHNLHDILRVVTLVKNRGKGGGVTHGLRHVRGGYVLFADADGASKFSDVGKLIEGCEEVLDGSFRGVAIGSRAHLVGSEAVVKVRKTQPCSSALRTSITMLTISPSVLLYETFSCVLSTWSSPFSHHQLHHVSAIPNAASNSSRASPYRTLCPTCTPRAGSSTLRC